MGIIYITCFFVSIFILLNLALFIYNKFREGFECTVPVGFSDQVNDRKNGNYLETEFGGSRRDDEPLLDGDGKPIMQNGTKITISSVLGRDAPFDGEYNCNNFKEYINSTPKWRKDEYTIDNQIIYPFEFQKAITTGCKKTLCNLLKTDNNITNFGMNKKQQQDLAGINEILAKSHKPDPVVSGFSLSNIWSLNSVGEFSVHSVKDEKTNWHPNGPDDDPKFFSQTSDIIDVSGFKGIIDGKDKLLAWTNDVDNNSKLFTCTKPCDGVVNIWNYDAKTITSGDQTNVNYYNIKDMTSDETFNWMITSYGNKNYIDKKLNKGDDYLNHKNDEYKNYFKDGDKFIQRSNSNIYWKNINIDRTDNQKYNPVQITNNKNYVIILSHTNNTSNNTSNTSKNGIYICKKPCTGEIYNWHKILDDVNKEITLIRGDFSDNILWYINKSGELWNLTIPDNIPSETTMFAEGYEKAKTDQEIITKTEKRKYSFSGGNKEVKQVYGGDKKYLWVIFKEDNNLHGVMRTISGKLTSPLTINRTITNTKPTTKFIVEESALNRPQQIKCKGSSPDNFLLQNCKTMTNNEETVITDEYCKGPTCGLHDFNQCCTFNQKCSEKKEDNGLFCTDAGMGGFKDDLNNLYCAGPECKKTPPDDEPHGDVFVCCKPKPNNTCNQNTRTDEIGKNLVPLVNADVVFPWETSKYINLLHYSRNNSVLALPVTIESDKDKQDLRLKIKDEMLKIGGYCTGIYSKCSTKSTDDGNTPFMCESDVDFEATKAVKENNPVTAEYSGRQINEACIETCSAGQKCVIKGTTQMCESVDVEEGGIRGNKDEREYANDSTGTSLLSSEEVRIRGLTYKQTEELKKNHYDAGVAAGSFKKWDSITGNEIKTNSFRNTIDVLKTKYIWSFRLPKKVINDLLRLPYLDRINLGLEKFLLETIESTDFKNTNKEDILISYNRKAIVTALYKLSKKKHTIDDEQNWGEIINDEWIHGRSFKTTNLTLKDLDINKMPWGYKSRNVFKKEETGTTDSWNKLGDTSGVGKHLYGNTGVRNPYDSTNPHPHQNDFVLKN